MKRLLFLVGMLFSVIAGASRARLQALSSSFHLIDEQTIFYKPTNLLYLDDLVLLETGATAATTTSNGGEAMLLYSVDDSKRMAMAFGHQDDSVLEMRNFISGLTGSSIESAQNPIHLFYSSDESTTPYALGISFSNKNDKLASLKETSVGMNLGFEIGKFQLNTIYVPINSDEMSGGKKFNGDGYWKGSVSYFLDETEFEFSYQTSKAKLATEASGIETVNELHTKDVVVLSLADSDLKLDNDFFWGTQIILTSINCKVSGSNDCDKKFTSTILPAWFGIENQANDWLTVRASIKQFFLVNISKDEFGYPGTIVSGANGAVSDLQAGVNSTQVATGLGFKLNKLKLDGVLLSTASQTLGFNNLLTQASVSYVY